MIRFPLPRLNIRDVAALLAAWGLTYVLELDPAQLEDWARHNGWRGVVAAAVMAALRLYAKQRAAKQAAAGLEGLEGASSSEASSPR